MLVGKRINGRYKIIDMIGGGGMSHVYLAHDMILNREVAIKILRYDFSNEEELHRRFQREALAATSLAHPNIVSIYDVGEDGDLHFIVMEYIEGKTLKQYIQEFSPVSPAKAIQIMKQLTSAISHAHEHQIIHRDIKPQNILMDQKGNVKITDFGIATSLSATSYTQTNSVIGTVHYLSPEQARGGITSHKSDIYALGIVLYELLTGELPFSGESAVSIALKHLQAETPSVRAINAAIPQSLENVVIRATAKDPNHRYLNVDEMEADLDTAVSLARSNEIKFAVPTDDNETKVLPIVKVPQKIEGEKTKPKLIEPTKEQVVKKKSKMPFVIGGILLALVLAFVGYQLLKPEKIEIPSVATLSLEDAMKQLQDLGFVIGEVTERNDENIELNHVIESNPRAGILREKGSEIDLVVSLGIESSEMIDYVSRQIEQVQAMLENQFVDIIVDKVYSHLPVGEIIEQSPLAGESIIPAETTIVFKVSQGRKLVKVSNLSLYTQPALKDYERSSGLVVKIKGEETSETVPAGSVISQTPKEGVEIAEGETVEVVLSKGPQEKVPKVYEKVITIPYEPSVEGEKQTIQVYIRDKTHALGDLYDEFTITENRTYRFTLEILEGETADYQILRDNQVFEKDSISNNSTN